MPPARSSPSRAIEERAFHRWAARTLRGPGVGRLPVGDDTAAIPLGGRRVALLTSDALAEGTHFSRRSPPRAVGAAAAAVSLSDVAAKGGTPVAFLLDLLLPIGTRESWAREVLLGAEEMLARFGAHVVGGDTKPARSLAVVGSLLGFGRSDALAPRGAARAGDLLVVTGPVGRGGFAARAFRRGHTLTAREELAVLDVRPRVREGPRLAPLVHAMTDTSDGLADAARLMAEASRVRFVVEAARVPFYPGLVRAGGTEAERLSIAFYGGDYELLAAIASTRLWAARAALAPLGCPLTIVGRVERGRGAWLDRSGTRSLLPRAGWRPFDRRRA